MAKHRPTRVPDFSPTRKPTPARGTTKDDTHGQGAGATHPPAPRAKPAATSAKSGRRGQ
jgi:hypothetical protein